MPRATVHHYTGKFFSFSFNRFCAKISITIVGVNIVLPYLTLPSVADTWPNIGGGGKPIVLKR